MLKKAVENLKIEASIKVIDKDTEFTATYGEIACIDLDILPADLPIGEVSSEAGHAAFEYLRTAIELANEQKSMPFVQRL